MSERPNLRELLTAAQTGNGMAPQGDKAEAPAPEKKPAASRKPAQPRHQGDEAPSEKASTKGKSSNPAYGRLTVYVPKTLRTRAERKWEDSGGKDVSDLVERLLTEYLNT